jgi:hypothetical protein
LAEAEDPMRRALFAAIAVTAVVTADPASAATFTLSNYTVSLHETDPGLVVYATDLATKPYSFELDGIGSQKTIPLFRLGTNESTVNWQNGEDTTPYPISVLFEFSSPPPGFSGTAHGTTTGVVNTSLFAFLDPCWKVYGGCGRVQWDNPTLLPFGDTGILSITLTERKFRVGDYSRVDATFTWLDGELTSTQDDGGTRNQVPEPGLLLMSAVGLAMGAGRYRRRRVIQRG